MQPIGYKPITSDRLDVTFAALADPTRRAILARLASGEATVTELAEPFAMSQPAVSKHLKVLERAGLISQGRDAQRRPRRLAAGPLLEATEWLERYRRMLEGNFQRLDALLDELKTTERENERSNNSVALAATASTNSRARGNRSRTARSRFLTKPTGE
jgi:DNA-binding transcriptional ArsR family regulator